MVFTNYSQIHPQNIFCLPDYVVEETWEWREKLVLDVQGIQTNSDVDSDVWITN